MPILPNSKHERFAQALAQGRSASAAYVEAGYPAHGSNAARLSKNEFVRARVDELLAAGAEKAGVTVQRIVDELAKIGFANMQDYMRVGPDGDPHLDFSDLTRDQAAALGEVTVEDFKDGRGENARDVRRVKFKLHDKLSALEKLGKHLGMFRDKVEHSGPGGGPSPLTAPKDAPAVMSIVADTPFDMRQYSIEGPSGFLNIGPKEWRPIHEPSKKVLVWPNGCRALLFSAEDPESTRGASGSFFWWDEGSDEMGIVVAGVRDDDHACVLADLTERLSPDAAARRAIRAYDDWRADRIVGEVNNGGEWIGQTIRLTAQAMRSEPLPHRAVRKRRVRHLRRRDRRCPQRSSRSSHSPLHLCRTGHRLD